MNKKTYLIGPEYFGKYVFVLKIVLGAVLIGLSIATVVGGAFSADKSIGDVISGYFASLISGLAQGFVWVTLIFAFLEYKGVDLPRIKDEKVMVGRGNSRKDKSIIPIGEGVAGIIFTTVFIAILILVPQVIAAYIPLDREVIRIPIFDVNELVKYNTFLIGIFVFSIAKETVKLVFRRWNIRCAVLYTIMAVASITFFIAVFFKPEVWNPNFYSEVFNSLKAKESSWQDLELIIFMIGRFIKYAAIVGFLGGNLLDIGGAVYKGIKYQWREDAESI